MKPHSLVFPLLLISLDSLSSQLIPQGELLGNQVQTQLGRFQYVCGSDPYRFYSEFPCNMYPVCINGGFKINVGCSADYQCTPYSQNAVCVNSCCCTVPRIIGPDTPVTTTRRFFDSASVSLTPIHFGLFVGILMLLLV